MRSDPPRSRRPGLRLAAVLLVGVAVCGQADNAQAFSLDQVAAQAKALAGKSFQAPPQVPEFLRRLDYEAWQALRYRPEKALWRGKGLPFEVQFFHPGYHYDHAVGIKIANQYGVGRLPFEKKRFIYPDPGFRSRVPDNLGYAGLRLQYPLNHHEYKDEIASFLGASYFRAVGRAQHYGLSARGLAVNTALPSGEEFPYFKTFWLQEPQPDSDTVTVYALLDSASITGAYRFVIRPGASTVMDVEARLFPRKKIAKLGIAPLTSMFMFSQARDNQRFQDQHPELHDSDGLMIATASGEWIWRPLVNPKSLAINSFMGPSPKGFGLMQRDRNLAHYQDNQAHYEQRPSLWVMPQGNWGSGHLELVQIPSDSKKNDNIVVYWVADAPVKAGQPLHFAYRLSWQMQEPMRPPAGYAVATYTSASKQGKNQPGTRKVAIDFTGDALRDLPADADVNARVDVGKGGKLLQAAVRKVTAAGNWRMVFHVARNKPDTQVELRAYLAGADGGALTETWSYTLGL